MGQYNYVKHKEFGNTVRNISEINIITLFCYLSIFGKKKALWHEPKGLKKSTTLSESGFTGFA
jgi:hypothetical protein